jgi:magnesium chelatase subunit I
LDLSGFTDLVADGAIIETGDLVPAEELLGQIGTVPGLAKVLDRLGLGDAPSPGQAASGVEFVLEGLHLARRLAKELTDDGRTLYGN